MKGKNTGEGDIRLCKIVWNSNFWIKPMERSWNPSFINNSNKPYEQQHGFVHEDWLFNSGFIIDGYHYGYIRGIGKLNSSIKSLDRVYLFTINPYTKERFLVGKLNNVERLIEEELSKSVLKWFRSKNNEIVMDLKLIGANYGIIKRDPLIPNLRFKVEDKDLFPTPLLIKSSWFDKKYTRTTPMKIDNKLFHLFNDLENKLAFNFSASNPELKSGGYVKHTKEGKTNVDKVHNEMEKALFNYLLEKGLHKSNIACDTTSFGGKLADVVVKVDKNAFDIYEIKTDTDLRRGLRGAVGQLLDYASWEVDIEIKNIYAVLPYFQLSNNMEEFIQRLKKNIRHNFKVLFYDQSTGAFHIK